MKVNTKLHYLLIPLVLGASFGLVKNVDCSKASAASFVDTDMSSIALLDGEQFNNAGIIYDDFSGNTLGNNWVISHRKWGGYDNKGVSADNVFLDTKNDKVIIRALGNQHLENNTVNGVGGPVSGGALVMKETARPGRYEVKMKAAYRVGVCNAFWTYTENNLGQNHEIDIEFPFKDNKGNNAFNEVIFTNYIGEDNFQQTHKTLDYYLNDGEYHTYAFDWYYSSSHKVIRYYIDSILLASHNISSKLPFLPSRLWLGCWIPNNPGFVGLPDFDQCFMEIDYFKYSPFANQESVTTGQAGGCGQTSTDYHIGNTPFDKYDWMSNGSFHSINKSQSLEDRGYEVSGNVLLYNGFDHNNSTTSGGLKMGVGSSIQHKIDSTYAGFKYKLSTYYKGSGRAQMLFYNENNGLIKTLPLVLPQKSEWGYIGYNFEIPANTFYTKIKFEANDSELYLDDISVLIIKDEPIQEIIVVSITITGPNKTTYKVGDSLDLTGLVVKAQFSDGSENAVTGYSVSDVDMSTPGTKRVTIRYQDQEASFSITVDKAGHSSVTLSSIAIEGTYKTQYNLGEELDLTGLIVRGYYSDGSNKEITNYQVNDVDMTTPGTKRVTIIYIDKMASFEIEVNAIAYKVNQTVAIIVVSSAIGGGVIIAGAVILTVIIRKRKHH